MQHFSIENQDVSAALEEIKDAIALEAFSVSSIMNRIADLVPRLAQAGKAFMSDVNKDKPTIRPMTFSTSVLEKALQPTAYMKLGTLSHPVPPGFNGNLYEYAKVLESAVEYANDTPAKLTDFNILLSKLISSGDARKEIRDVAATYKQHDKARELLAFAQKPFFSGGSRVTHAAYGDVISSNNQYLQYVNLVANIIELSSQVGIKGVEIQVQDAHDLLQAITQDAANGKLNDISPQALVGLSEATNAIARSVEFYSLTLWALSHLRKCTQEGAEAMIKALRY